MKFREEGLEGLIWVPGMQMNASIDPDKEYLIAAVGKKVYALDYMGGKFKIGQFDHFVNALACHPREPIIYAATENTIHAILLLMKEKNLTSQPIKERPNEITGLAIANGALYDCGGYPGLFETFKDKNILSRLDEQRIGTALTSYKGQIGTWLACLFQDYTILFKNTATGVESSEFSQKNIHAFNLAINNGASYLCKATGNELIIENRSQEIIATRKGSYVAIHAVNGKLYDGTQNRSIYETLEDPEGKYPLWIFDDVVLDIESLPHKLWREFAFRGERE